MAFRELWDKAIKRAKERKVKQTDIAKRTGRRSRQFIDHGRRDPKKLSLELVVAFAEACGLNRVEVEELAYAWLKERMNDEIWSKAALQALESAAKEAGPQWLELVRRKFIESFRELEDN